ncbi:Molybdate-binding protein ModA [Burkholderiales bacterium 8X]|nr:Molybdate-binding protein ModA [Burkholderiales bacterium 8X]
MKLLPALRWAAVALLAALPCFAAFAATDAPGEVRVAVAANFAQPMKAIADAFERQTGHKVLQSAGATGKLFAQINEGAPFDLFLSADAEAPQKLEQLGRIAAGSRFTYAVGTLVLWSAMPNMVFAGGEILKSKDIEHVAIAAPKLAPYGAAAMETLRRLNLLAQVEPKLVQGESIGQAYGFIASGNAEVGFVALSQVWEDGRIKRGSGWIVPSHLHEPIRQEAVLLARARNNAAAIAFYDYLRSEPIRDMIRAFGYGN